MNEGPDTVEPPATDRALVRAATLTTLATTSAVIPVFLIGAVAVLLREDLSLAAGDVGLVVSCSFAGSAMMSAVGGRLVDRIGPWRALRLTATSSAAILLLFALAAHNLPVLVALSFVGGCANGLTQPAGNAALAQGGYRRPALTFGIKQASIPFATLLAGASVPIVAVNFGWRGAFLAASPLPLLIALLMPRQERTVWKEHGAALPPRGRVSASLVLLAAAAGLGAACATSLAAYLAEGAAAVGIAVGATGWLISACGVVGIVARVVVGWAGDRTDGSLLVRISLLLVVGAAGYGLLALGTPTTFAIGSMLVYAFGWGWGGLLMYTVVRLHPESPAAATGVIGSGTASGATLGPMAVGQTIEAFSYGTAWVAVALTSLAAGMLVLIARRSFVRAIHRATTSPRAQQPTRSEGGLGSQRS